MSGEQASAFNLLESIRKSFGIGEKKAPETPMVAVATPTAAPTETSTPADLTVPPEPTPTMMPPGPAATETPAPVAEFSAPPDSDLPDWMQDGKEEEEVEAPLPEASASAPILAPEAPPALPPVEAPVAPLAELPVSTGTAAEAEKSPEQLAIEQFEESLLSADGVLTRVRTGESLDETQLRAAKAAAAKANGSIRNLPERYLRVLLASRRLGENRDYTRMDFQKDMLAAIRVFSQTKKG